MVTVCLLRFGDENTLPVRGWCNANIRTEDVLCRGGVKAHKALRAASGLGPEMFPVQAFVGMISDEIEALRSRGKSDDEIAQIVRENSAIEISPTEIKEHYASPEERQR